MSKQPVRLDDLIEHVMSQHPDGDALQHLADAVETSAHLGEVADHLIGHFVDQARRTGASWTEIGQYMGVSKQAAQKRFVPKETKADELDLPTSGLFTRFTPRARNVVEASEKQARDLGHAQIRSQHIALALFTEPEGLAAKAMVALGASEQQVRETILATLGPADESVPKRLKFTRGAKKTLQLALREALHLGHNYIGTEHILLGLLRNEDEIAAQLLIGLGVTRDETEQWTVRALEEIKQKLGN
ncbi:Clp protease N-terminal domain-containing protein [Streptantibioticus rubrisoli]|uniref:ATP-dependent Clp protease ATP-binding subunit n=1 Tax=Streptantibioticus rubrisoli TaxID=1387313 RepID=A0ABT1PHV5_9ACTN|nr:Clp protease N-terminal domain-containing protein [Streptantibioticus rubrisoli]MCQ4044946.1 ATP-dependent Clp protease ATP-binding subunit [Streptantibioticus rubrisoli]